MLTVFRSLSWPARIGLFLLIVCTLVSLGMTVANAQTVPGTAKIDWILPTTGCTVGVTPCDNKPLTGADALTAVEVYISTANIPDNSSMQPTVTLPANATTTTQTLQVANGSTLFVRVKAVNGAGKSPFSTQLTKQVVVPVTPGVPTSVTITLTITP